MKSTLLKAILSAIAASAMLTACHPPARTPDTAAGRTFTYDSIPRSYLVYAPKARPSHPALILVLHGWKGSGPEIERRTNFQFDRLADRDGFIVAYPDAVAGQWHSGHPGEAATADDVGFLAALIEALSKTYGVDPDRVYVTGFSNGASMTYRLACERPDRIAAIAPVSGGLAEGLMPGCVRGRPVPMLLIHGTADPVVPFDSGELEGNLAFWVRRNGCATSPTAAWLADADPRDGTRTRIDRYAGCREGADVVLYAIQGGGHHWPGGVEPVRLQPRGRTSHDFDGASVIWEFLKAHPRPPAWQPAASPTPTGP